MRRLFRSIPAAAGLLAVLVFAQASAQSGDTGALRIVRPSDDDAAPAAGARSEGLRSTMNRVFGPGNWRSTSGYRSPAEEDRLRLEGAGTVPAGRISRHSMGTPDAPGAYDAVVYGMSQQQAAARLRGADSGAFRVLAEAAHGPEGPHLHIEPVGAGTRGPPAKAAVACDSIYLRVIGGRRNPALASC